MLTETHISPIVDAKPAARPVLTSYDSGYEHSLEHLIEVRCLVEEENRPRSVARRRSGVEKGTWQAAISA